MSTREITTSRVNTAIACLEASIDEMSWAAYWIAKNADYSNSEIAEELDREIKELVDVVSRTRELQKKLLSSDIKLVQRAS